MNLQGIVSVTNLENGCNNVSETFEWNPTSISSSENEADNNSVYPNPAIDQLTIEGIPENEVISIRLMNDKGAIILTEKDINGNSHSIPTRNIPSGLYILKITSKNSTLLKKVILSE